MLEDPPYLSVWGDLNQVLSLHYQSVPASLSSTILTVFPLPSVYSHYAPQISDTAIYLTLEMLLLKHANQLPTSFGVNSSLVFIPSSVCLLEFSDHLES